MRRVGLLSGGRADDPEIQARITAFVQALQQMGWTDGRNVRIDYRWGEGNADTIRKSTAELIALSPDVILTPGGPALERLRQVTRTIPIVFVITPDPVGSSLVESLSRPGGNATGFMQFKYNLCAKWPELLKEIAPGMTRAAVLRDPDTSNGIGQFAVIQSAAPSLGVEVIPINVRDARAVERAVTAFALSGNGGLIVTASALAQVHRDLIIMLAARYKLPAVYSTRFYVTGGGLVSYGADFVDQYRRAATYVDRILKGEKPAGLPVQAPTKYELVINLKTAKALGIAVPQTLLAEDISAASISASSGRSASPRAIASCRRVIPASLRPPSLLPLASYVDKILKSKFELVINLKTARALGLDVPTTLLGRADEVIE
jgi:putative ABC transport system substrate-binding protein